jgi:glycosyltransferase involved in cell wall biosynthesis
MIAKIAFWSSILFILYAYLGYPLILMVLSAFRSRPVKKGNFTPSVSFIITAYNEEKRIQEKVENTLKQNYPKEKLEIIVASDCSTDRTDEIVKSYGPQGIRLVGSPQRMGKEAAQKLALNGSSGEILVFSDVATELSPDGVLNIVKNFYDPTVGCVSSQDRLLDPEGRISGEGAYVRYEMLLRRLESRVNSVVGLSGSFFAMRREVCQDWATDLQSDFNTLLNTIKLGMRGVSDPESVGYYRTILDDQQEFDRKVRTVLRGITVLMRSLPMLNPLLYGLFSWQLISHKLARWLVPFVLLLALISNGFLVTHSVFYRVTFILQLGFYMMAMASIKYTGSWARPLFRIMSYFALVNLSILSAWYLYIRKERVVAWSPSER